MNEGEKDDTTLEQSFVSDRKSDLAIREQANSGPF